MQYTTFLIDLQADFHCKSKSVIVDLQSHSNYKCDRREGQIMFISTFLATVAADVVAYFIIKWLDR